MGNIMVKEKKLSLMGESMKENIRMVGGMVKEHLLTLVVGSM